MPAPAEVLTNLMDRIAARYGNAAPDEGQQVDQAELQALIDEALAGLDEEEPEKFTDDQPTDPPPGPAPIADQTAVTPDSHRVEQLLSIAQSEGSKFLSTLASNALTRYAKAGGAHLFNAGDRKKLQAKLAESIAAADLLGRSRVRLRDAKVQSGPVKKFADQPTDWGAVAVPAIELQPPMEALKYFKSLVPAIGVDPLTWLKDIEARAFTMAVATEQTLLDKVQAEIASRMTSGEYGWGPQAIQDLIEAAGVSSTNPQYPEMVFRTNVKDALAKGAHEELQDPDVLPNFPVWKYSAVGGERGDGRNRPEHLAKNGNYYPSQVPFTKVRGEDPGDACNCRCDFISIDKWDWAELQKNGARLAKGYEAFGM